MENVNEQGLVRAMATGAHLFYVVTENERYTEGIVARAAIEAKVGDTLYVWTCTDGFLRGNTAAPKTQDALAALDFALAQPGPALFLMKDLAAFWHDNPFILRKLKTFAAGGGAKTLVVLGQDERTPLALREDLTVFRQGLPSVPEIRAFLEQAAKRNEHLAKICAGDPGLLGKLVEASQGLDLVEIARAVRALGISPKSRGEEIVQALFESKRQLVGRSGIMEFVVNETGPEKVGGMENLKHWMTRREKAFGLEAITSGKRMPKGVLMMGVAGCGKSLFVKAIAAHWHLPLIRLDMAAVYEGTFGTPETSLRKAFRTAEAAAPCVLWIDEIEAGISTQGFKVEGGPASRVLGSFLTWMQEKTAPVFVAATANAIEMLPAEILRKGRFDEIFYVGLPDPAAREEIFRIHLAAQKIDLALFNVPLLASSTRGFSGAEIEQAVLSAAFEALSESRPLSHQDVLAAIGRTVPMSVTMAEQIKKIESWAFKRAVPASGKAG
ncbi:MAG: AAA family ATPase [Candidatus Methylomirabilia bacterium]